MSRVIVILMLVLMAAASSGGALVLYEDEDALELGFSGPYDDQRFAAAWDAAAWEAFADTLPDLAKHRMPDVDFDTQFAVGVYMGEKPTGGYRTAVARVEQEDQWLVAVIAQREPAPDEPVTQAFTYPVGFAVMDKSKVTAAEETPKGVRFVDPEGNELQKICF